MKHPLNRRAFLRILALGVVSQTFDVERFLWVPGAKTIFIPDAYTRTHVSMADIVAMEMELMVPKLRSLFERDDVFFKLLKKNEPIRFS